MKTNKDHVKACRKRKNDKGLLRKEYWATAPIHQQLKELRDRLMPQ